MGTGASEGSGPQDKSFVETMVEFTKAANDAVENNTAEDLAKKWTEKRDELINKVRGDLSKEERTKATTMITLLQEQIYTAKGLPDNWATEVKYEASEVGYTASCGENTIQLGNNFPEGQMRLVVTPLTRICRQKIFEGAATGKIVHFFGPPGTGKTETMKDTLADLGCDVRIFPCTDSTKSDEIKDAIAEGKPIVFDMFSNLPKELQKEFATIALAHRYHRHEEQAIGITCNWGRDVPDGQWIPDEVSSQCVSLEMSIPDFALIAEIMFFCEGFLEGQAVGAKLANVLSACKEQLSKQCHYDFGICTINFVTKICAAVARKEAYNDENLIVARTTLQLICRSLIAADREPFKGIVKEHLFVDRAICFV